MAIYEFNGKSPKIGKGTWVAQSAEIIGDVKIGKKCWIGPGAVIRGDFGSIVIDDETAVEDGVIIHSAGMVHINKRVTIGHMAMIHNATIEEYVVIGMSTTVCDNAVVGAWSIVAEHSLVKKNQTVKAYSIYAGIPAEKKSSLEQRHKDYMIWGKQIYVDLAARYLSSLKRIDSAP